MKFTDEILEKALPDIHKIYDDMTVKELQSLTFERMPQEIQEAIKKAQADFNLENKIYPISEATESDDGKTCNWCGLDLVVKETTVVNGSGATNKRKILSCPTGGMLCKIDAKKGSLKKQITEDLKKLENQTIYTLNTRHYEIADAKHIYGINRKERSVAPPNDQFTKIDFATERIFEYDLLKGEAKKLQTIIQCDHETENQIDFETGVLKALTSYENQTLEKAEFHHLVKLEKIGRIGLHDTYHCHKCRAIDEKMKPDPDDKYYSIEMTDAEQQEKIDEVIHYRITVQRIDSNVEKEILKILRELRQKGDSRFFKSASLEEALRKKSYTLTVGHSLKTFINARLKKLANKGVLEVEGRAWSFGFSFEGQYQQYGNYLDDATKLNHYRFFDPFAKFLTKQAQEEYELIKESERSGSHPVTRENRHNFFLKIAKQYGLESNEITIGNTDSQINLEMKVKKKNA